MPPSDAPAGINRGGTGFNRLLDINEEELDDPGLLFYEEDDSSSEDGSNAAFSGSYEDASIDDLREVCS